MTEFKKISDVELVETPTESDNLLIVSEGVVKQVPATAIGGGSSGDCIMIIPDNDDEYYYNTGNCHRLDGKPITEDIMQEFLNGVRIYFQWRGAYNLCTAYDIGHGCHRLLFTCVGDWSSNGVPGICFKQICIE